MDKVLVNIEVLHWYDKELTALEYFSDKITGIALTQEDNVYLILDAKKENKELYELLKDIFGKHVKKYGELMIKKEIRWRE